jgi:hypothetical protein
LKSRPYSHTIFSVKFTLILQNYQIRNVDILDKLLWLAVFWVRVQKSLNLSTFIFSFANLLVRFKWIIVGSLTSSTFIFSLMVTALASDAVDRGFEPRSVQTKDYKVGICCFSDKHTALRRKNKCSLARNQDSASEWGDMSIVGLLFLWASTIKVQLSVLV